MIRSPIPWSRAMGIPTIHCSSSIPPPGNCGPPGSLITRRMEHPLACGYRRRTSSIFPPSHAFTIDLIDSDLFSPISLDANLMLWLDAMDGDTLDRGDFLGDLGTPEDGNETRFWADKSGHHHHAVRISGSPVYESAGLHGLPSIDTSGDNLSC